MTSHDDIGLIAAVLQNLHEAEIFARQQGRNELVDLGGYRWQRGGLGVISPGLNVGGGGT